MNLKETVHELASRAAGLRILYVEDDPLVCENTRLMLETLFSEVDTASNGYEGVQRYQNHRHDIVITDILMPEMNGVAMIRGIKEMNPHQPFIVTSACEESDYLLELINLGVAQFLLKPVQTERLIQIIHQVVTNLYNKRKVHEFTAHLKQELLHQTTLLEQYKEVVDISTIVTKTDIHGRIVYVNDSFCQTSGYCTDEVVSKSHSILRHPHTDSQLYENLWKTILNKQVWRGTIKNIKKNGEHYITDTTVKPILDEYGNIIDFISISHDITELFSLNEEITNTQHEMLLLLGEIGETRSQETGNHVRRVAKYARLFGNLCGLEEEEVKLLYSASPMHDIGKIGIPDAILLKPGALSPQEYAVMQNHCTIGYNLLKNSHRPLFRAAAIIAHEHHEKWDGTGYPKGHRGDEIHVFGRIVALADAFDALNCERIYKKAWPMEEIVTFIKNERGKHFDPELVNLFLTNIEQFMEIAREYKDQ